MPPAVVLTYYCVLILLASVLGGLVPLWFRLTHRWMEVAVSFVAGTMLGVATLHMLPHALLGAIGTANPVEATGRIVSQMLALLAGFLTMFFIERFFCFHHHEAPAEPGSSADHVHVHHGDQPCSHHNHDASEEPPAHDLTWGGAAAGLALHSVLGGIALAASVAHGAHGGWLPGFGTFLVIVLHKPFDSLTIAALMARSRQSTTAVCVVNALFSLAIPLGAVLFEWGLRDSGPTPSGLVPLALAFSAGVFLCISLSDLLPELQFHHHDRLKLSAALVLGLLLAHFAGLLERRAHLAVPSPAPPTGSAIVAPPAP